MRSQTVRPPSPVAEIGPVSWLIPAVARTHRAIVADELRTLGLYPGQEMLLMLLWESDDQSQSDLARALGVEPPTVAKMVARLEAGGFVVRRRSSADARKMVVSLTAAGRAAQQHIVAFWADLERRTTRGMSAADTAAAIALLTRLAENVAAED